MKLKRERVRAGGNLLQDFVLRSFLLKQQEDAACFDLHVTDVSTEEKHQTILWKHCPALKLIALSMG